MKVTLLGSGASTGSPIPTCSCAVCASGLPKNQRMRTSCFIESDFGEQILIDCSADFRSQALKNSIRAIDYVLFTHAHADHILGIDDLRMYTWAVKKTFPCFASATTWSRIKKVFSYVFEPDVEYRGSSVTQLDAIQVENLVPFQVGQTKVIPAQVVHGSIPVTAFRLGKLSYITDVNDIPPASANVLSDPEVLIIGALRRETHGSHFTIEQAVEWSIRLRAKRTILVHLSHSVDYNEESKRMPPGVELGYDGLTFEV